MDYIDISTYDDEILVINPPSFELSLSEDDQVIVFGNISNYQLPEMMKQQHTGLHAAQDNFLIDDEDDAAPFGAYTQHDNKELLISSAPNEMLADKSASGAPVNNKDLFIHNYQLSEDIVQLLRLKAKIAGYPSHG